MILLNIWFGIVVLSTAVTAFFVFDNLVLHGMVAQELRRWVAVKIGLAAQESNAGNHV
jgi:hypothetical protein